MQAAVRQGDWPRRDRKGKQRSICGRREEGEGLNVKKKYVMLTYIILSIEHTMLT
jgi:hypothetical protein